MLHFMIRLVFSLTGWMPQRYLEGIEPVLKLQLRLPLPPGWIRGGEIGFDVKFSNSTQKVLPKDAIAFKTWMHGIDRKIKLLLLRGGPCEARKQIQSYLATCTERERLPFTVTLT